MPRLLRSVDETKVHARRLGVKKHFIVNAKTIGTAISYPLMSENISLTGMLLNWDVHSYVKIPFIKNTIIEMYIDRERSFLENPILCLGKVVRTYQCDESQTYKYGVHIIQIDSKDLAEWELKVRLLEREFALDVVDFLVAS